MVSALRFCHCNERSLLDAASNCLRRLSLATRFAKAFACLSIKSPYLRYFLEKTPLPHRVRESRFSSGAKHHLHAPLGAPRLADSTSRWILTDLHRVADIAPYQYPFLVSSRDAHCLRGQYGRHQKQNPRRLRWGMARWHGQSRSLENGKDIVTTHAPPKCSGVAILYRRLPSRPADDSAHQ